MKEKKTRARLLTRAANHAIYVRLMIPELLHAAHVQRFDYVYIELVGNGVGVHAMSSLPSAFSIRLLPGSDSYQPHNPPAINLIAINDTSNHQEPATTTATPCQTQ